MQQIIEYKLQNIKDANINASANKICNFLYETLQFQMI